MTRFKGIATKYGEFFLLVFLERVLQRWPDLRGLRLRRSGADQMSPPILQVATMTRFKGIATMMRDISSLEICRWWVATMTRFKGIATSNFCCLYDRKNPPLVATMTRFKGIATKRSIIINVVIDSFQLQRWPDLRGLRPSCEKNDFIASLVLQRWPDLRGLRRKEREIFAPFSPKVATMTRFKGIATQTLL